MLLQKLPDFTNVVAAGRAVLSLKDFLGPTVRRIVLELGGTFTKAMMTEVMVRVNGKPIFQISGADLDAWNKYRGLFDEATHLTIDFTEPRARTIVGQEWGALDTSREAGITDLSVEVQIAGATGPTLQAWAETTAPQPTDSAYKGLMTAYMTGPAAISAAGSFTLPIPRGSQPGALLKRVGIFHANVTKVSIKRNGVYIFEEVTVPPNIFIQKEYQRVPQAGLFMIDFVVDGNQSNAVPTRDAILEMRVTTSAADNLRIFGDVYAPLAAI